MWDVALILSPLVAPLGLRVLLLVPAVLPVAFATRLRRAVVRSEEHSREAQRAEQDEEATA